MNKKELFITEIEALIKEGKITLSEDANLYFTSLKTSETKEKKPFTENGLKILSYLKEHYTDYNNLFTAKNIAEDLEVSSRTVSGAMRRLVSDNFVEKMGEGSPTQYSLTNKGIEVNLDEYLTN